MRRRKKFLPHLLLSLVFIVATIFFVIYFSPQQTFSLFTFQIPVIIPFFIFLFFSISLLATFLLTNLRRGILISIFAVSFLLLQYFNYNSILYTTLLIAIVVLVEILFWKKK
jgi:hypothetical protein